jgi:glycosyltransferase involved in cell wall biosynthesis
MTLLDIVVPCFNEEEALPQTVGRLAGLLDGLIQQRKIDPASLVFLVDDGSRDRTWSVITALAAEHGFVRGIRLSRNRGHQNALLAGLFHASGEAVISIDADLQDDLGAIEQMIDAYEAGSDVVYGVRRRRGTDTFFKRFTATGYYRLLARMGVDVVYNHADYRLLSRRAIEALREYREVNIFVRGIVPQLGFPSAVVLYDRGERIAGESKYPLRKMLAFAWQGITSFSAVPLRLITAIGIIVSLGSFGVTLWALIASLFTSTVVPGWASTVLPIYFLGGIQLLCIGIIGEYVAKIYMESKHRPRYFIQETTAEPSVGPALDQAQRARETVR